MGAARSAFESYRTSCAALSVTGTSIPSWEELGEGHEVRAHWEAAVRGVPLAEQLALVRARLEERQVVAGRSELGRRLAIALTDLEKLRVWLAAISSNGIDLG